MQESFCLTGQGRPGVFSTQRTTTTRPSNRGIGITSVEEASAPFANVEWPCTNSESRRARRTSAASAATCPQCPCCKMMPSPLLLLLANQTRKKKDSGLPTPLAWVSESKLVFRHAAPLGIHWVLRCACDGVACTQKCCVHLDKASRA